MASASIRLIAWSLILGSAIASFVAAIYLSRIEWAASLIVDAAGPGQIANWLFFLLTISIALSVYVLRSVAGGEWSINPIGLSVICGIAIGLLMFGLRGLVVFGAICVIGCIVTVQRRRRS